MAPAAAVYWMIGGNLEKKNIGFVSTRFAGKDGVSLEANKWADIFESSGHGVFWFAGELDHHPDKSMLIPEAHFQHQENRWIDERIWGVKGRAPEISDKIHTLRGYLKIQLHRFIKRNKIDLLIPENALTIPMHIPLGLALAETIAETQIPTLAHHHDFFWERTRFSLSGVNDYLHMAFPPYLPNIKHTVINSAAQEELALRTGISSTIVPNVLDFENPPVIDADRTVAFKKFIGLEPEDVIILQPTRIVQRKGIEHAIKLVKALKDPRYKLLISHDAGDEGFEYAQWLGEYACEQGVDLRLINTCIGDPWSCRIDGFDQYSLWDIYTFADFITYPSLNEGFGNAFLEAVYFKKPMLINRYATFIRDIEPLGFDLVVMDGFLNKQVITGVKEVLESSRRKEQMVSTNYRIATRHYSYAVLRMLLNTILYDFFGEPLNAPPFSKTYEKGPIILQGAEAIPDAYQQFGGEQCAVSS
jgi:mannosylglucosylglycerate synthase